MDIRDFLPKRKIKALVGFKIIAVRGKEEWLILHHVVNPKTTIEITTELICEPIVENKEISFL